MAPTRPKTSNGGRIIPLVPRKSTRGIARTIHRVRAYTVGKPTAQKSTYRRKSSSSSSPSPSDKSSSGGSDAINEVGRSCLKKDWQRFDVEGKKPVITELEIRTRPSADSSIKSGKKSEEDVNPTQKSHVSGITRYTGGEVGGMGSNRIPKRKR